MPLRTASSADPVPNRALITVSIMLATIMQALDTTIANVALPYMQGSLSAAQDQITWVLTSYIVAAAIMTPVTGWITGRFGLKRVFLVSVAGFTLTSMLCGGASSLGGGLFNSFTSSAGTVTLTNCTLSNNSGQTGGGIFDGEVAVGAFVDERGDPVTMHGPGSEGTEHEEVECALDERERRRFRHASP